jgi:hypothetical protein
MNYDIAPSNSVVSPAGTGTAVTAADGALATEGSKSDAAVTNPALSGSMVSLLKGIISVLNAGITTVLGTSANVIGAVTQSGTWTVGLSAGTNTIGNVYPRPETTAGNTAFRLSAAVAVTGNIKSSLGQVYALSIINSAASTRYLHFYASSSAPTLGTSVPVCTIPIPATSALNMQLDYGVALAAGISYAITTDDAATPTTGASVGDVQGTVYYTYFYS